jgi:hypothetical protein
MSDISASNVRPWMPERREGRLDVAQPARLRPPPAWQRPAVDGRLGGADRVVQGFLLRLHLGLGGRADADHRGAPEGLARRSFSFVAVVVAGGLVDLAAELLDPAGDAGLVAAAADDRDVVLADDHTPWPTELVQRDVLQLQPQLLGSDLSAREDGWMERCAWSEREAIEHAASAAPGVRSVEDRITVGY